MGDGSHYCFKCTTTIYFYKVKLDKSLEDILKVQKFSELHIYYNFKKFIEDAMILTLRQTEKIASYLTYKFNSI